MKKIFTKKIIIFLIFSVIFFSLGELIIRLSGWKEPPIIYQEIPDSDIMWVHMPNYEGMFFVTFVKINSKGLRDYEYPYDKSKDTFRILTIGECSTFGHSVYLQDTFSKQLEKILNKVVSSKHYEVINGGVVQYDDLQKFAFLQKEGLKYNPDFIIFSHDIDYKPWIDMKQRTRLFRKIGSKIPGNFYFLRYIYKRLAENLTNYLEQKLVKEKKGYINYVKLRYEKKGTYIAKSEEALKRLSKLSREENIPVLVTLFPWLGSLGEEEYPFKEIHNFFNKECKKNGLLFLDFYEDFFKNKNVEIFRVGQKEYLRRPNRYAHQIIAEQIYKYMISSGIQIE